MEHSSHAHPLPHGEISPSHEAPLSGTSCIITSSPSSIAASESPSEGLSRQARLLRLRNVGFRASTLPTRRVSPLFGASLAGNDVCIRPSSKENSPSNAERRATYGEDLPPNPTSILQELENSARRKTGTPKPALTKVFQDGTTQNMQSGIEGTSWYNEASSTCSPAAMTTSSLNKRKLCEISGNQRTPPSILSVAKHAVGRSISRRQPRSLSLELTQHIEYLEQELALAKAKNESNASPGARKRLSTKLRALCAENKTLRFELEEWHKKGAKEEEEVVKHLVFESEMKDRLDALEAECEMKDARIGDLEWEMECMKIKVRDAEGLERVNADLEKRIDTLTNLATTSLKTDARSNTDSPNKYDFTKRASRPRSTVAITPSSPGGVACLSLATVSEIVYQQSQQSHQLGSAPETYESATMSQHPVASPDCLHSPSQTKIVNSPTAAESSTKSGYFTSHSRASMSMRSAPSSSSRRTSFISTSSFGVPSWGTKLLSENDEFSTSPRKRRMRRFASGSKSLKPLVLPTTSNFISLPVSAPVYPSLESKAVQSYLDTSLDATNASIPKRASTSAILTPIQPLPRQAIAEAARDEALKALEGRRTSLAMSTCQKVLSASPSDEPDEGATTDAIFGKTKHPLNPRPRSLHEELKDAEPMQSKPRDLVLTSEKPFEEDLMSASKDGILDSNRLLTGAEGTSSEVPIANDHKFQQSQSEVLSSTGETKANLAKSPTAKVAVKGCPSSTLHPFQAQGVFARLTSVLHQSNQDPLLIAKRVCRNAWSLGANHLLGGLGWWLLGLIYHRHRKNLGLKRTDANTVDALSNRRERLLQHGDENGLCEQGLQRPHFSADLDKSRAAKQHFKDYGATWLSPTRLRKKNELPLFLPCDRADTRSHPFPCSECVEPSSRRTLRLWLHFSLTIVMAIAMAVKHGPGALLAKLPDHQISEDHPANDSVGCGEEHKMRSDQMDTG